MRIPRGVFIATVMSLVTSASFVLPSEASAADGPVSSWTVGKPLPFAATRFDGATVGERIYFLGFRAGDDTTDGSIWYYDTKAAKYTDTGIDMLEPVSNYTIAALTDSVGLGLYIFGGRNGAGKTVTTVQVFRPSRGTVEVVNEPWPGTTPSGCTSLPATGVAVVDNKAYVIGGTAFSSSTPPCSDEDSGETWIFDPKQTENRWSRGPDLKVPRGYVTPAVVGKTIYAIGGTENTAGTLTAQATVEAWTVGSASWSDTKAADLPQPCDESQAFGFDHGQLANNVVLAGCGQWPTALSDVQQYDIVKNKWSKIGALNEARRNHAGATITEGQTTRLMLFGGWNADASAVLNTVEIATAKGTSDGGGGGAVPHAPIAQSANSTPLGVEVTWFPNVEQDGATDYVVTVRASSASPPPGCEGDSATTSSLNTAYTMDGLCLGVAYEAVVAAVNAAGQGPDSNVTNSAVPSPATVPTTPLVTAVRARHAQLTVAWLPSGNDGGHALTGYVLTATASGSPVTVNAGPNDTEAVITGLVDGTQYSITVTAKNDLGTSSPGTTAGTPRAAYAPSAPESLTVTPKSEGVVNVQWTPPDDDGGSALSSYRISYQQVERRGDAWVPVSGAPKNVVNAGGGATQIDVPGIAPADGYWLFDVAAVNGAGTGTAAVASGPVVAQFELQPGTLVLDGDTLAGLASYTDGMLTWPDPAPAAIASVKPGAVLVGGVSAMTPDGLMRIVERVADVGGVFSVLTAQATIGQAFEKMSFAVKLNPLADGSAGFRPAAPGLTVPTSAGADGVKPSQSFSQSYPFGLHLNEEGSLPPPGSGFHINGDITVTPTVSFDTQLSWPKLLKPRLQMSAGAKLEVKASFNAEVFMKREWLIWTYTGPTLTVYIGPVPVTVSVSMPVTLTADGKIAVHLGATLSASAGASWDSDDADSLHPYRSFTFAPDSPAGIPGFDLKGTLTVSLVATPTLLIYGTTGPAIVLTASLKADVTFEKVQTPYLVIIFTPSLSADIAWVVNLEIHFLKKLLNICLCIHKTWSLPLGSQTFDSRTTKIPIQHVVTVTPTYATVPAGSQKQFTVQGAVGAVTWSLGEATSADSISSNGLATVGLPANRTVKVLVKDETGVTAYAQLGVGCPYDPLNLKTTIDVVTNRAKLTWQTPTQLCGKTLDGYRFSLKDVGTGGQSLPITLAADATSRTVEMSAGSKYQVSLGAFIKIYEDKYVFSSATASFSSPWQTVGDVSHRFKALTTTKPVGGLAFTPDRSTLVSTGTAYLAVTGSDPATGKELWSRNDLGVERTLPAVVSSDSASVFVSGVSAGHNKIAAIDAHTGELRWQNAASLFGGDDPTGVVVGPGSTPPAYVLADPTSQDGFGLAAYNGTGAVSWSHLYAPPAGHTQSAPSSLAINATGSTLYVLGQDTVSGHNESVITAYKATDGTQLWTAAVGATGDDTQLRALALNPLSGEVYISGTVTRSGSTGSVTTAYDPTTGQKHWTVTGLTAVVPGSVTVSAGGDGAHLFLGATVAAATDASAHDMATMAIDTAAGAAKWSATYSSKKGSSDDIMSAVKASPDGTKVVVVGVTAGASAPDGVHKLAINTITYDAISGTVIWKAVDNVKKASPAPLGATISPDGGSMIRSDSMSKRTSTYLMIGPGI